MERQTREYVHVLIVVPDDDMRASLMRILDHSSWVLLTAASCEEAATAMSTRAIPVVVCACGHEWAAILDEAHRRIPSPRVVVTGRMVDETMCAEVLSLGGYDVLAQPFNRKEVFRTLSSAWLSWHEETQRQVIVAA